MWLTHDAAEVALRCCLSSYSPLLTRVPPCCKPTVAASHAGVPLFPPLAALLSANPPRWSPQLLDRRIGDFWFPCLSIVASLFRSLSLSLSLPFSLFQSWLCDKCIDIWHTHTHTHLTLGCWGLRAASFPARLVLCSSIIGNYIVVYEYSVYSKRFTIYVY